MHRCCCGSLASHSQSAGSLSGLSLEPCIPALAARKYTLKPSIADRSIFLPLSLPPMQSCSLFVRQLYCELCESSCYISHNFFIRYSQRSTSLPHPPFTHRKSRPISIVIALGHDPDIWVIRGIAVGGAWSASFWGSDTDEVTSHCIRGVSPWIYPAIGCVCNECKYALHSQLNEKFTIVAGADNIQSGHPGIHCGNQ